MARSEDNIINEYLDRNLKYKRPNLALINQMDEGVQKNLYEESNDFKKNVSDRGINESEDNNDIKSTDTINKDEIDKKKPELTGVYDRSNHNNSNIEPKTLLGITPSNSDLSTMTPQLPKSKSQLYRINDGNNNKIKDYCQSLNNLSFTVKIYIIFKRNDYPLRINPKITVKTLRSMISSLISLPIERMELKNKELDLMKPETDNYKLYNILIRHSYPFFEVRKKYSYQMIDGLHPRVYNYKVIVGNVASGRELYKHINIFFDNNMLDKDFYPEPIYDGCYSIGFPFMNAAYDFKRYLILLKRNDISFRNINFKIESKFNKVKCNNIIKNETKNSSCNKDYMARLNYSKHIQSNYKNTRSSNKSMRNLEEIKDDLLKKRVKYNNILPLITKNVNHYNSKQNF